MAYVIGRAADLGVGRNVGLMFAAMLVGDAVSFLLGYLWLIAMSGSASWIDQANVFGSAFAVAVAPFLVWDLVKMAFAAITVTGLTAAFPALSSHAARHKTRPRGRVFFYALFAAWAPASTGSAQCNA